ncbi:hypothetical protein PSPO01_15966 [Paraphaeosphaeria sporulosa]
MASARYLFESHRTSLQPDLAQVPPARELFSYRIPN